MSPGALHTRLSMRVPVQELQPSLDQFNRLMDRVEGAYLQLESFNADVAHELRTPLSVLIGQTEVALSRQRGVEDLQEILQSNLEELQRLARMVQDMLFLSRADRGEVARRGEPVSLAAIVREVIDFHEAALDERGLAVAVQGDADARIDENLFKQAVSNLLDNAARYAAPGSAILIAVRQEEDRAVSVSVQNHGATISGEHLPRLFDRFFRIEPARADGAASHGLGLAIVAAIARMHAGSTLAASRDGVTRIGFRIAPG